MLGLSVSDVCSSQFIRMPSRLAAEETRMLIRYEVDIATSGKDLKMYFREAVKSETKQYEIVI